MHEVLVSDDWLIRPEFVPRFARNQKNQYGKQTAAKRENTPHQALPVRRDLWRVDGRGWRYSVLAPYRDGLVFKAVNRTPAGEGQKRIVIMIPHKYPFQSVVIRMREHRAKCIEARFAEIL